MDFLIKLLLNAVAITITGFILSGGVVIDSFFYALLLAALLTLLNVTLKPILVVLTLPATLFSLGLFMFVINSLIILLADYILTPGFKVTSFWYALGFSIILSIINSIFDRLAVKAKHRQDNVQIFDKDGNRIA